MVVAWLKNPREYFNIVKMKDLVAPNQANRSTRYILTLKDEAYTALREERTKDNYFPERMTVDIYQNGTANLHIALKKFRVRELNGG